MSDRDWSYRTVIQELGREGILPFSSFFASNRPFNAPLAGIFTEYLVSCIYLFAVPPGDAYIFLINSKLKHLCDFDCVYKLRFLCTVASYARNVVYTLVSFGLLLLYTPSYRIWDWSPPFRTPKFIIYVYFLSNLLLVVVPFFPPASRTYEKLPYWVCCCLYFYIFCLFRHWIIFTFLSRTQSAASLSPSLVSHIGIYGVLGFQKEKGIFFSVNGLVGKMVSLDMYSAEYLGLWYHTLLWVRPVKQDQSFVVCTLSE